MKSYTHQILSTLIFLLIMGIPYQMAFSQAQHILPEGLKEKRQALGELENTDRYPQVFDFRKGNGFEKTGATSGNAWLPGEFEESQAVVISWGSYDADNDVDTTSNLAVISAKLCIGIQPEAPVWIRIHKASDSLPVKRYMEELGQPLYNYRFIVKHGDAWWARDFGPIGYYKGDQDSLHFADFKYYPGREHDNALPASIGYRNGWKNTVTRMNYEGGNLIADGFGTVFYSDVVSQANSATGTHFPTLASSLVADSMRKVLQADVAVQLPALNCDGGTGHLDLYLKLMDEETWIAAQYPTQITASDKALSEANITLIKNRNSVYNRPFRVFRVPIPTDNNGSYSSQISCNGLNNFGRSFINGITVNKTFIYPIWDSPGSGNTNQRLQLEANMKKWFPGMKLFGIDVRAMTGFGGQLHCITMQIPAENPVKFWHPAWRDLQALKPEYRLLATIQNKSGIDTAFCKWRVGSQGAWNHLALVDSSGFFVARIPGAGLSLGDTVQYYLSANTNNGKTAFKPITAPEGYYEFVITDFTQILNKELAGGLSIYPNPGNGMVHIESSVSGDLEIKVMDAAGRQWHKQTLKGMDKTQEINLGHLPSGLYLFVFSENGKMIGTRKYAKF
jgi:agmatine/peptidylarginine deiminase